MNIRSVCNINVILSNTCLLVFQKSVFAFSRNNFKMRKKYLKNTISHLLTTIPHLKPMYMADDRVDEKKIYGLTVPPQEVSNHQMMQFLFYPIFLKS